MSYHWSRDGVFLHRLPTANYTLTVQDLGHTMTVTAIGTRPGLSRVAVTSAPFAVPLGRIRVGRVHVVGIPAVGNRLTAGAAVSDGPRASARTYRWMRNGTSIPAATSAGYTLTKADAGKRISVEIGYTTPGFHPTSAVGSVKKVWLKGVKKAKIVGSPKVGKVVKARVGSWRPSAGATAKITYIWRAGSFTKTTTKPEVTLPKKAKGKMLMLTVSVKAPGFEPVRLFASRSKVR
jgi:arabinogalactan endo-1,4-beta-galactosidase